MDETNPGFNSVEKYLSTQSCTWVLNPPHVSHMGGAWKRMIGIAHRILDCMLLEQRKSCLAHEVLTTLMAEIAAIMNAKPLIPVSLDLESPFILTPAMPRTLKTNLVPPPPSGNFVEANLFGEEWKRVQGLADVFGAGGYVSTSKHCSFSTSGEENRRASKKRTALLKDKMSGLWASSGWNQIDSGSSASFYKDSVN